MVISPKPTLAHDLASLVEAQKSAARQIDAVSDAVEASFTAPGNPIDAAMQRLHDTVKTARDTIADSLLEVSALVGDLIRSLSVCTHALGEAYTPAVQSESRPVAGPEEAPEPVVLPLPLPTPDASPVEDDDAAVLTIDGESLAWSPEDRVAIAANPPVGTDGGVGEEGASGGGVKKPAARRKRK